MRAVLIEEFGGPEVLRVAEVADPEVAADELLVRVSVCGVCGHDVLARSGRLGGRLPRILGHEITGTVELAGDAVTDLRAGDRVVLSQRRTCGRCAACRAGRSNLCIRGPGFYGEDLPGGYAEYVVADARNAVKLPDEVPDAAAAALPCGVLTALHALRRAEVRFGETVAIVGAGGGVGIHAVALAALAGARVVAVTHSPAKCDRLREAGADIVVVSATEDGAREVRAAAGRIDTVIDCVGVTLPLSLRIVSSGGRVALLGNIDPGDSDFAAGLAILKEIELFGSSHGTVDELALAVDLVARRALVPVVSATFPAEGAAEAHRRLRDPTAVGRVLLALR